MVARVVGDSGIRTAELIAALAVATDLGSGQPMEHALRRCLVAMRFGEALGLPDDELRTIYYVALLQYVGCTADAHLLAAALGDEVAAGDWWSKIATAQPLEVLAAIAQNLGADHAPLQRARMLGLVIRGMPTLQEVPIAHCEVGQRLAEQLGFGAEIQSALAQVYERWDGKGAPGVARGEAIARSVRVVRLAQDAETFYRQGGVNAAVAVARKRAGTAHDPRLVDSFCRVADRLFVGIDGGPLWDAVLEVEPLRAGNLSESQLDTALQAIADFADLKIPALAGHSRGVAALAEEAARRCHLPPDDVVAVKRAGWLHDLGRVGVSAGIWGKADRLTEGEWERVRLHPYFTERILARSPSLAQLGAVAGLHHERLDGSGYYRGAPASQLPIVSRLLAIADVYRALTEPRPHRPARVPAQAAEVVRAEVLKGRLDGELVAGVLAAAGHRAAVRRPDRPARLSEREVEVLRLVARGLSNRQMAGRLILSKETVNNHVRHIYDKIGVSSRAAAALYAMQHGLLEDFDAPEK